MKSPTRSRVLLIVAALGLAAAAAFALRPAAAPVAAKAAGAVMELDAADVAVARSEPIAVTLALSGLLQPLAESVLTAAVEGRLEAVLVRPGESVQAGQVLARIDTRDLAARLAEQEANLAASRAQLDLAEKTQRRNEELRTRNFISANSLDVGRSSLDANREVLHAREAQLALARQALDKATIRAPQAGIVSERAVQPGQHVGMNARLFAVVDLSELEFAASVPVSQVGAVRVGQAVVVAAEGAAGAAQGRVERIAPTVDAATRMIAVYVRVANRDGRLKGGMAARGQLRLGEVADAVTLPREALRGSGEQRTVLVMAGGRAEMRSVQTGVVDEASGRVEIKAGVAAGETAILARVGGVVPGQAVTAAKAAAPAAPAVAAAAAPAR
ncbi:MAG: efflux RND transporter periplasmic adaptor subunit [Rhodocyclales bacterium]|nr:efflux RND transporter periplasmic adaptor subunit [Rhodocyclales bacterium]